MKPRCAYCGVSVSRADREHVVPKCLYPTSKSNSKVQRLTVPACNACNNGWSDDEAHFRNVMLLSGKPNDAVHELWKTTTTRSFNQVDGKRRVLDLFDQLIPVQAPEGHRHLIFPAKDKRVLRVVRKVIRGLCYHHGLLSALSEERVWVDILKYIVPEEFLVEMSVHHREADIFEYRYLVVNDLGIHSCWLLTFFECRTFIGIVACGDGKQPWKSEEP